MRDFFAGALTRGWMEKIKARTMRENVNRRVYESYCATAVLCSTIPRLFDFGFGVHTHTAGQPSSPGTRFWWGLVLVDDNYLVESRYV